MYCAFHLNKTPSLYSYVYSDGDFLYFSMFKKMDNLIDQQIPIIFFAFSVDVFVSSVMFLKGFTSTFNKDEGSTYNEKTWSLGKALETSISPTCLNSSAQKEEEISWI